MAPVGLGKRKCQPTNFLNVDQLNLSNDDDEKDAFHSSDNEDDATYQPEKKRKCQKKEAGASSIIKNYFKPKSKLTPKQRLERLNAKFEKENTPSEIKSNRIETVAAADTDASQIIANNYDVLFDAEEAQQMHSVKTDASTVIPSSAHDDDAQNRLLNLILGIQDGINGVKTDIQMMRRQLARLEMKSMGCGQTSTNELRIQPELLLDFDAELAKVGLPIGTCVELIELERKLRQDTKFREKLVALLSVINGSDGNKKGGKMIKSLFYTVIDGELKSKFTWTGKSNGQKKMAFNEFNEIIGLLYSVVRLADSSYTRKDCEFDITYKILKHAVTKQKSKNSAVSGIDIDINAPSTPSHVPLNESRDEPSTSKAFNFELESQESEDDSKMLGTLMKLLKRCSK